MGDGSKPADRWGVDDVVTEDDIRLGMIGVSEGNGHPYSFSTIINGYSDEGLANSGWDVIYEYVREKDSSEIGLPGVTVTHAWTQHEEETERLCRAAKIPHAVDSPDSLIGAVDGVVIARDDYESHYDLAMPFLQADLPVFVDKPLSLDVSELKELEPYLRDGQLMSCSGMRYARELDGPRASLDTYGDLRLIQGRVIKDWERYGVHLLDAIFYVIDSRPITVSALNSAHDSISIQTTGDTLVQIDSLGAVPMTFDISFYGTDRTTHHSLEDNFRAFRRLLWHFVESIRTDEPSVPTDTTLDIMRILIAGQRALNGAKQVEISELGL